MAPRPISETFGETRASRLHGAMRCLECGAEFDELNESQPVCPACGAPPGIGRDDEHACALLDDAALIAAAPDETEDADAGLGLDQQDEPVRMPLHLQEARG